MIRIENKLIAYDSVTMTAIEPQYLGITEKEIIEYMKDHPMPEDPLYCPQELIADLTGSEGMYILPAGIKEETIQYIEDLLNQLMR